MTDRFGVSKPSCKSVMPPDNLKIYIDNKQGFCRASLWCTNQIGSHSNIRPSTQNFPTKKWTIYGNLFPVLFQLHFVPDFYKWNSQWFIEILFQAMSLQLTSSLILLFTTKFLEVLEGCHWKCTFKDRTTSKNNAQ